MSLKLQNTWKWKGGDWWDWDAFIDGEPDELADIEFVDYVLHESFPEPKVRIDTPSDGFRLRTEGWGTFTLKAFVQLKNGKRIRLQHELELYSVPDKGTSK